MKRVLPALLLSIALAACVATTPRIEESRLREVRAGVTSYADIVKHFGTASLVSKNPDGTSFATYVYSDPGANPKEIVPLVAGAYRDSVTFHFDTKGILADVKTTSRTGGEEAPVAEAPSPKVSPSTPEAVSTAISAPAAAPAVRPKSSGFLWRIPDWLPAAPRENR